MQINNRKIIDIELDGESDDIQVVSACYDDTGEELTDNELDYLTDNYPESLYEIWLNKQISKIDFLD